VIDQVWQHIGNQKVHDDITLLILKQQWLVIGQGTGNREQGTGNRELGTGNRKWAMGNGQ
jgi:hypothetical protein